MFLLCNQLLHCVHIGLTYQICLLFDHCVSYQHTSFTSWLHSLCICCVLAGHFAVTFQMYWLDTFQMKPSVYLGTHSSYIQNFSRIFPLVTWQSNMDRTRDVSTVYPLDTSAHSPGVYMYIQLPPPYNPIPNKS